MVLNLKFYSNTWGIIFEHRFFLKVEMKTKNIRDMEDGAKRFNIYIIRVQEKERMDM